jgi:hypothetical protein
LYQFCHWPGDGTLSAAAAPISALVEVRALPHEQLVLDGEV